MGFNAPDKQEGYVFSAFMFLVSPKDSCSVSICRLLWQRQEDCSINNKDEAETYEKIDKRIKDNFTISVGELAPG